MIWSIIQTIGKQGITLLIFAVLALLLNPKDFGVLGMAMMWITFIQVFSEIGFGAALIQRQNVNSNHFSTIFFINIVFGIFLAIAGIILSWPCAIFFKTPQIRPIMAVLSFSFIINSFSLTQLVIAQKELRFKGLAIRDISASLIGGVAGIILAMLKFGVWSLVVQTLTTYLLGSVLLWYISEWRPKLKEFSFECVRDLWDYSSRIFAFQVLKYFAQNTDKLIIGYFLGPVTLGFYTFAYKILVYPVSVFVGAIGIYLFPKFSRTQKDLNSIKLSYLFINKATNIVVFPAIIIVAVLCPIFIPFIWGEKWIPAIPLIQILSILGILIPTVSYVGQVMKALDHPGWLFNWSIFITILVFMLTWIGLALFGIMGATVGLVVSYVLALPLNFWILIKLIDTSFKDVLGLCMPAIVSIFFMIIGFVWMAINGKFFDSFIISASLFLSLIFYLLIVVFIDRPFLKVLFRKVITLSI